MKEDAQQCKDKEYNTMYEGSYILTPPYANVRPLDTHDWRPFRGSSNDFYHVDHHESVGSTSKAAKP